MPNGTSSAAQPGKSNSKKQPRLGRGLSALVGTNPPARVDPAPAAESKHIPNSGPHLIEADIERVRANPYQPRRGFDDDALASLAESIKADGVMQPIVVRAIADGYELVAGERRLRASKLAGMKTIPAIVREVDDRTSAELALIENLQRADLNPVDRALAFRALIDRHGLTQADLGQRLGVDRSAVANHLRLLDLGEQVLAMLSEGRLGYAHGRALAGVHDAEARTELAANAATEGWSARATERAVAEWNTQPKPVLSTPETNTTQQTEDDDAPSRARAVLDDMERKLGEHLGTRVALKTDPGGQKGSVTISFFSLDEFDGILDRLGYRPEMT
ncbi:MAG: ParB/RepB/Spo0J family partition protein [Phycisphaerales bacterium]